MKARVLHKYRMMEKYTQRGNKQWLGYCSVMTESCQVMWLRFLLRGHYHSTEKGMISQYTCAVTFWFFYFLFFICLILPSPHSSCQSGLWCLLGLSVDYRLLSLIHKRHKATRSSSWCLYASASLLAHFIYHTNTATLSVIGWRELAYSAGLARDLTVTD